MKGGGECCVVVRNWLQLQVEIRHRVYSTSILRKIRNRTRHRLLLRMLIFVPVRFVVPRRFIFVREDLILESTFRYSHQNQQPAEPWMVSIRLRQLVPRLPAPKIKMTAEDDIGDILDEIDRNLSGVKQGMKDSCMNYGSEVQVQVHV